MRLALAALLLVPSVAQAGKLKGISADGTRILVEGNLVCAPIAARADGSAVDDPACEEVKDKKALAAYKFKLPAKVKTTADKNFKLTTKITEVAFLEVYATDARKTPITLVSFDSKGLVQSIRGPWLSKQGNVLVVEYTVNIKGKNVIESAAFDIGVPLAAAKPAAGGAADRALKAGGKWRQNLVPCDTAGVLMVVKPNHSFSITIDTRCSSDRDHLVVYGIWDAKDPDELELTFDNMNADAEKTKVKISKCPEADNNEDCLSWQEDDVTFLLYPAKK
jgi:hypothetical protein